MSAPGGRPRRPAAREMLIAALAARAGPAAQVRALPSQSWASATFAGERHRLEIGLPDAGAADVFQAGLADAEFSLRGHLLADIAIAGRRAVPAGLLIEVEALTIEES
ncbi:MAG: hypothetical protein DI605_04710 [Sphingomonas sp.]|nr:MAG: hypothetical protein DI605_04710 [Sphingomonas sp.]